MPSIIEVDTIKNKTGTQNTVLSTDGSGNNTLNAGVIKSNTGSNTWLTIASDGQITVNQNNPTLTLGSNATLPADSVVQFIWDYTNTFTGITNTSAPGDSWLEKPITPKYSNSKILISIQFCYSKEDSYTGYTRLYRDTSGGSNTWIYPYTSDRGYSLRGGSTGWGVQTGFIQYVDTPGSGTHTYKCYSYTSDSSYPMYINKNFNNSQDANSGGRASSSIVLMEIKVWSQKLMRY